MIAKRIFFEGRVQGVGFRYTTKDLTRGFDVTGTVKNLPDDRVELVIIGEKSEVAEFLHELTVESGLAHHIKNFTEEEIAPLPEIKGFSIIS